MEFWCKDRVRAFRRHAAGTAPARCRYGGQVGPRSVKNAFRKLVFVKNMDVASVLRFPIYKNAFLEPKMASKMPQDRPKRAPRWS